jgi:hypothetical protein
MNGKTILSEFPKERQLSADRIQRDYKATVDYEGRKPDIAFKVFVKDDAKFDAAANDHSSRKTWSAFPSSDPEKSETNCVVAAETALEAGGVPVQPKAMPGNLGDRLNFLAKTFIFLGQTPTVTVVPPPK